MAGYTHTHTHIHTATEIEDCYTQKHGYFYVFAW